MKAGDIFFIRRVRERQDKAESDGCCIHHENIPASLLWKGSGQREYLIVSIEFTHDQDPLNRKPFRNYLQEMIVFS